LLLLAVALLVGLFFALYLQRFLNWRPCVRAQALQTWRAWASPAGGAESYAAAYVAW